ncbi:MAG TPA: DMT family transporter [Novosphingobium sp.]
MQSLSRPRVYAMLIVVLLLWAGNSIVGRAVRDDIPPFSLALFRWTGALAILLPFAWRRILRDRKTIMARWPVILMLGALGVGAFNALLYSGLRHTTATNALLIQAGIPALVLAFDFAIFKNRPSPAQIAGVTIAATGVATIVFKADPSAVFALRFGQGDLLVLAAVVAWGLYTALLRLRPPIDPLSFLALTFMIGVAAMLPGAAVEWRHATIRATPVVIGAIAYVALLPSLVAYLLFNRAVAEIGAADAGQVISLQPLFGALLAAPLLGEALHPYHAAGMVLILLGLAVPLALRRATPPIRRPS